MVKWTCTCDKHPTSTQTTQYINKTHTQKTNFNLKNKRTTKQQKKTNNNKKRPTWKKGLSMHT
jgi:hypothetical protein